MAGPALRVTRVPNQLAWQAAGPDGEPAGMVRAWLRPDQRCSVFFDSAVRPDACQSLTAAVAAELGRDLYTTVDEGAAAQLAACANAGFTVSRREGYYRIPTGPPLAGAGMALPAALTVLSASAADEDRLRLLDDELRQDVPGTDGWQWDAEGFRQETFGPDFDPATYLVAVDEATGEYAGLVRVWNSPSAPRLGLIAVRRGYRRRGLARALLGRAFGVLSQRGLAEVTAEIDDANVASRTLLGSLGAERTGGCAELVLRR